jgi:thiamine kinase-like enzyme
MEEQLKKHIEKHIKPAVFNLNNYNSIGIKKLAAGCYNVNYLVKINSKKFVFRVSVHSDDFEGDNLENEFKTLSKLNGFHSPKVFWIDHNFKYPFIVEEFIKADKIKKLSNLDVKNIAKSLAEIHNFSSVNRTKSLSIKNGYIPKFNQRLKTIKKNPEMYKELSKYVDKAKKYCELNEEYFKTKSTIKLLHGDMHCGNIFLKDKQVIFIDWENNKYNDPVFDIVAFFYESENLQYFNENNSISKEHKRIFLNEYLKINPDKHLKKKLDIIYPLRWLSDTLWLACRIVDYENIPKDLREKLKEEYLRLYDFNMQKLYQLWK